MKSVLKHIAAAAAISLSALLLIAGVALFSSDSADASEYYNIKKPAANAVYKVGDKVPVSFYAGVTITETKCDAWGRPVSTTYETMPAEVRVFKGSTLLFKKSFTYTAPTTITTSFVPKTTGTLKICVYGHDRGLNQHTMDLQATQTIKVKKKAASAVKRVKPVISVERTAKKQATITCENDYGYGMKVYRSLKKNGTYKLIKSVKKGTFVDKKLKASKVYYYKVKLFAKSGKKTYTSKWSAKKKADKYTAGISLSYTASKGVKVFWRKINGAGYYLVSRNTKGTSGEYEVISCEDNTTTVYYDKDVEKGKTYYYAVIAEDEASKLVGKYMTNQFKIKIP